MNLKAVINVSQIVAKQMIDSKTGGSIVHVSSQVCCLVSSKSCYCSSIFTILVYRPLGHL